MMDLHSSLRVSSVHVYWFPSLQPVYKIYSTLFILSELQSGTFSVLLSSGLRPDVSALESNCTQINFPQFCGTANVRVIICELQIWTVVTVECEGIRYNSWVIAHLVTQDCQTVWSVDML